MIYLSPKISVYEAIKIAADNSMSFRRDLNGNLEMVPNTPVEDIIYPVEDHDYCASQTGDQQCKA